MYKKNEKMREIERDCNVKMRFLYLYSNAICYWQGFVISDKLYRSFSFFLFFFFFYFISALDCVLDLDK